MQCIVLQIPVTNFKAAKLTSSYASLFPNIFPSFPHFPMLFPQIPYKPAN